MAKNMTEGKPIKLILQFAIPLLIGNILQQTYNLIDAALVGKILGEKALAAVGASSSVQFLVMGFCIGVCAGFGVPVAKSFGAGKLKEMRKDIFNAIILVCGLAVILTTACAVLCPWILHMLSVPGDIYADACDYLLIIFLGIPFSLLYNFLASILRSIGDSRTPFIFLAVSTVLNIVLDLGCILVLGWGCAGAAIATVAAQGISGICCLVYIIRKVKILHLEKEARKTDRKSFAKMLVMGFPMGIQYSITAIGSMVMQSANNGLGSVCVSGFTAGMRIKQFAMCPFDAVATGVSVFAGQNLGAKKMDRVRKGIKQGIAISVLYGIAIGLVLIFGGRMLTLMFVDKEAVAVLDASAKYLRCLGCFYWAIGFLNVARMTVQGLGYPGRAIFSGVTEMIARIVVSLVFVPMYGFTAICFADQTAWVSACLYIIPMCIICVRSAEKSVASDACYIRILEQVENG
ncbi:MAG: MATE family efflux transporter [Lachnospiraceae bacterium]|nr:MATE family efflux transporter [Lachnospiraceae bacterium]